MLKSKIIGLLAIALSTSACAVSDQVSQIAVSETLRAEYASTSSVSSKSAAMPSQVALVDVQQTSAVQVLNKTPQVVAKAAGTPSTLISAAPVGFRISAIDVQVPDNLVVSEADVYLPHADIVWREDPLGDRKAQIKTILHKALAVGTADFQGGREVILTARVGMFHALTEKARNSFGGKHNVQFDYVLTDVATGQQVGEGARVDASLKAYGGRKAYQAMRRGQTQKVRITQHVAEVIKEELTQQVN